jgi:hypothetical protein
VGDVDERDPDLALDALELELHLLAELEIERAERLVEEQDARVVDERAGERDALLLATRELLRLPALATREVDELEDLEDPSAPLLLLDALRSSPNATLSKTLMCGKSA